MIELTVPHPAAFALLPKRQYSVHVVGPLPPLPSVAPPLTEHAGSRVPPAIEVSASPATAVSTDRPTASSCVHDRCPLGSVMLNTSPVPQSLTVVVVCE